MGTGRGGRGWHKKERARGGEGGPTHKRNQSGSGGGGVVKARGNRYWDEGGIEERGVTVIGSGGGKGEW